MNDGAALLLSEIFPPQHGGSGRWFWELYRRLPAQAVVVAAGEHERQEEFDRTHEMRLYRLPLWQAQYGLRSWAGLRGYRRAMQSLRGVLRQERIDAVHAGRVLPEGWLAWLLKRRHGLPYLVYVHGEDISCYGQSRELSWMVRRVFRGAETVICNSDNSRQLVVGQWRVPREKVFLVHPGADVQRFVPADLEERARTTLGWNGRCVVLTVGRLQRRKGQDHLILALPIIRRRVPNVLYAIIGEGDESEYLRRLAREHGVEDAVQFRGAPADNELVRCYQQCDLFALPNRAVGADIEGFGMVLVEAQACGRPVIAGDSGGTAETMCVGQTGLIVDCTQTEILADAVTDLLLDAARRETLGRAGRKWAVEHFAWDALAREAAGVFARATHLPDNRNMALSASR